MKTHLNLSTSDLALATSFYATLLDAEPTKAFPDYTLFVTEQPALELALDLREVVLPTSDAHYGIYVETLGEVDLAIERLTSAGFATSIERQETCCYANQTKVWSNDPDGRRWEIYTVHDDVDDRNGGDDTCCSAGRPAGSCCS